MSKGPDTDFYGVPAGAGAAEVGKERDEPGELAAAAHTSTVQRGTHSAWQGLGPRSQVSGLAVVVAACSLGSGQDRPSEQG